MPPKDIQAQKRINAFKVLKLTAAASKTQIRKAYLQNAKLLHPDKNNGDKDKMAELNTAYETVYNDDSKGNELVTDPDDILANVRIFYETNSDKGYAPGESSVQTNVTLKTEFFRNVYDEMYRCASGRPPSLTGTDGGVSRFAPPKKPIVIDVPLTIADMYMGCTRTVVYGKHLSTPSRKDEALEITFPPGSIAGIEAPFHGEGDATVDGASPVDIIFRITQIPHPTIRCDKHDIHATVFVSPSFAEIGGASFVELTPEKRVFFTYRPFLGLPFTMVNIPRAGMPNFESESGWRGNMHVKVMVAKMSLE